MLIGGGLRLGRQSIVKALRASLERLGLQSIQLYQARTDHSWRTTFLCVKESAEEVDSLT